MVSVRIVLGLWSLDASQPWRYGLDKYWWDTILQRGAAHDYDRLTLRRRAEGRFTLKYSDRRVGIGAYYYTTSTPSEVFDFKYDVWFTLQPVGQNDVLFRPGRVKILWGSKYYLTPVLYPRVLRRKVVVSGYHRQAMLLPRCTVCSLSMYESDRCIQATQAPVAVVKGARLTPMHTAVLTNATLSGPVDRLRLHASRKTWRKSIFL